MGYHVGADKYTDRALKELSSYPNNCTIGIELCHTTWEGEFTPETLKSAGELVVDLCGRYGLGRGNVYRHFDITGKDCPRYFVAHEDQWLDFLESLKQI
jgi:N-acetylmuramoyl-L-alanine amidase